MSNYNFSILMANYNNGIFIKESIESVIKQTRKNWELIIIDDASTDNSVELIKPYLKDKRIQLSVNNKNLGCGGTKKRCAELASGEVFCILDPDDVLRENALEIIAKAYEDNPNCGFIYSTHYECGSDLAVKRIAGWVGDLEPGKTNLHTHKTSAFRTFTRSVYEKTSGIDAEQKRAVDKDLIFKLEEVTKLKFINQPLYFYRQHENNISLNNNAAEAKMFNIHAKYKAYQRRLKSGFYNLTAEEMSNELYDGLLQAIKSKNYKMARFFLSKAVCIYPLNYKAWAITLFRLFKYPVMKVKKICMRFQF